MSDSRPNTAYATQDSLRNWGKCEEGGEYQETGSAHHQSSPHCLGNECPFLPPERGRSARAPQRAYPLRYLTMAAANSFAAAGPFAVMTDPSTSTGFSESRAPPMSISLFDAWVV